MPQLTYARIEAIGALLIATLVGLVAASTAFASTDEEHEHPQQLSRETFRADMRELWEDHIVWTRQYIVSAATLPKVLPDAAPTADRLFRNQADIGAAIAS